MKRTTIVIIILLFILKGYAYAQNTIVSSCPIANGITSFVIKKNGDLISWGESCFSTSEGLFGFDPNSVTYEYGNKIMEDAIYVACSQWAAFAIDQEGFLWGWGGGRE